MLLKPGKYRYAELAEICGTSRTTAEKFPERYQLEETQVLYNGREVSGVLLDHEKIDRIAQDYPRVLKGIEEPSQLSFATPPTPVSNTDDALVEELRERIGSLESEISQLRKIETELKVENAGFKSDIRGLKREVEILEDRLKDKDAALEEVKRRAESERDRGDAFNNQISNLQEKMQMVKAGEAQKDEFQKMLQEYKESIDKQGQQQIEEVRKQKQEIADMLKRQQAETVIKVEHPEQPPIETPKKGYSFFGFRILKD